MMRALLLTILVLGCDGSSGDSPPEFTDTGGSLAIEGCGYTLTTRLGAEPPRKGPASGAAASADLDPTPRLVHLGIMGDPKTSMVVQWRTVDETTRATVIRWAQGANLPAEQLTETTNGVEFGYRATGTQIFRMHQAHLCGLSPGTTYSYQVGSTDRFSQVYSFTTAPDVVANPDAEILLANVGDSRDGYDVWSQLVSELDQRSPDLVLFTGDAVTIGITQFEWEEFFERGEPLLARVPLVFAHGNHEVNAVNFFSQFAMPGDQETFGFDYGHAHITVANDTPEDISYTTGKFKDAIAADFEASKDARWKIFMHHRPMYSSSTSHGSALDVRSAWLPLVDQYKIDLVITGHDHVYEISKPMRDNVVQASNADGTVYVVSGGAGAELYGAGTELHTQYSESTHSASVVRVRRDSMVMEAFRQDGTAIPAGFSKSK
jgi:3',5'-cyclic AMP phosphodiesterase CpdA